MYTCPARRGPRPVQAGDQPAPPSLSRSLSRSLSDCIFVPILVLIAVDEDRDNDRDKDRDGDLSGQRRRRSPVGWPHRQQKIQAKRQRRRRT
jgi:hypothetical protein